MAKKKSAGGETPVARAWAKTAGGNIKAIFTISPKQDEALRDEAFRRATQSGSRKPDASAVLREVLDAWLAKRK